MAWNRFLVFSCCLLLLTGVPRGHGGLTADLLKKLFPEAENFVTRQKALSPPALQKVEQASGSKVHDLDRNLTVYVAIGKDKSTGKTRSLGGVLMVDARGARGTVDLAVACALDGTVKKVLITSNKDDPALESPAFLRQMEGKRPSDPWNPETAFTLSGNPASAREVIRAVRRGVHLFLAFVGP